MATATYPPPPPFYRLYKDYEQDPTSAPEPPPLNNGKLPEDRIKAMTELQSVVAESHSAQLAFGEMGFPVILGVLRERDDVEMVRGAVETLVSALTSIAHVKLQPNEVQPALMNTDLLSR